MINIIYESFQIIRFLDLTKKTSRIPGRNWVLFSARKNYLVL